MRADRLIKLLLLLNRYGKMRADALAEQLEVSRRTIYRDLDALTIAGIPVCSEGGPGGGIWLDPEYGVSLTGLNQAELNALFVSSVAGPLTELGLDQAAEASLLKIFAAVPASQRLKVEYYQSRIYLDPTGWWQDYQGTEDLVPGLQSAVFDNRVLSMTYQRRDGELIQRSVQPYGLVAKAEGWYLVAATSDQFRTYRVSRIRDMQLMDERFARNADFDLRQHWQTYSQQFVHSVETYTFTLRVSPSRLAFLRLFTSGQMVIDDTRSNHTWLVVDFVVGTPEVAVMIVLGLGTHCEIVAPEALRARVSDQIQAVHARYLQDRAI